MHYLLLFLRITNEDNKVNWGSAQGFLSANCLAIIESAEASGRERLGFTRSLEFTLKMAE
jgi:hypothetical protein